MDGPSTKLIFISIYVFSLVDPMVWFPESVLHY